MTPAPFFIVGPTAIGKSALAAELAELAGGEIVSADAFQIYRGLDLLTAKPDAITLAKVPHHLIGAVDPMEEMNAEKFRALAVNAIAEIGARGRPAIVAGGSGLYLRALTEGFSPLPTANAQLREKLSALSLEELNAQLVQLDPATSARIDWANRRRVQRALEVCLLSGKPMSAQIEGERTQTAASGVFLYRERDDLYERIDARVRQIFAEGVVDEVRNAPARGTTASQTLGLREIQQLLRGELSEANCIARLQQGTRRYAKRQLTWFRGQTNFPSLNLSTHGRPEAIEWIAREARLSFARRDDRN